MHSINSEGPKATFSRRIQEYGNLEDAMRVGLQSGGRTYWMEYELVGQNVQLRPNDARQDVFCLFLDRRTGQGGRD